MRYAQMVSTRKTPQSQPIPGKSQVKNAAGGYVYQVDKWTRLQRFLLLGSDAPTYYATERKLTEENAQSVVECIREDGVRTVTEAVTVSVAGRAPKNDHAIFVLAMCAGIGDTATKKAALAALPQVARIGTHLFQFVDSVQAFRGWGRSLREAVSRWYNEMPLDKLCYQLVKYQQREGWSHRDVLRKAHPTTEGVRNEVYKWVTQGELPSAEGTDLLHAFEEAKQADNKQTIVSLIEQFDLPREAIPTQWLNEPVVWDALLQKMPLTAMVRNLGKMTQIGLIRPMSDAASLVCDELTSRDRLRKARVHPVNLLIALRTYASGGGYRGSLTWEAVPTVIDALDSAFYLAFDAVEATGKRIMVALDVSGSMGSAIGGLPLSCREAAAAMAMTTVRTERNHVVVGFTCAGDAVMKTSNGVQWAGLANGISLLTISPKQRLDDVVAYTESLAFGGTDCALPMLYALEKELEVDCFQLFTDNETWAGNIHPSQALQQYREKSGINARSVVCGMTATGYSIADPNDGGMLDVVGFDTSVPQVLANFIA